MARLYNEVIDTSCVSADPDLKKFVEALTIQIQAEYEEIFGTDDSKDNK